MTTGAHALSERDDTLRGVPDRSPEAGAGGAAGDAARILAAAWVPLTAVVALLAGAALRAADLVATFSILGALLLDQPVAGLVIVLMQSGGEALERRAERRASAAV